MQTELQTLLDRLESSKIVTDNDVLELRRAVFGDAHVSIAEADAIFRINDEATQKTMAWSEFFLEAMTDFMVRQTLPYGYVDDANAAWLIQRISRDGHVETVTELRTLVNILKTADDCTDRLVKFALEQVKAAVLHGEGVIGRSRTLEPGVIGAAEVELLRDIMYACGGDRHIAITRSEAEVLFDLNDACQNDKNDPSWTDLFVKGITNYLMFLTTYETPERTEVLRRETFLKSDSGIFAGFAKLKYKDVVGAFGDVFGGDKAVAASAQAEENLEAARILQAENIDAEEAAWLRSRIGKDGQFDKNEQALMAHLKAESPYLHISLQPLLNAA